MAYYISKIHSSAYDAVEHECILNFFKTWKAETIATLPEFG